MSRGSYVSSSFDSEEFGGGHLELDILCMTYTLTRACCLAARSTASKVCKERSLVLAP